MVSIRLHLGIVDSVVAIQAHDFIETTRLVSYSCDVWVVQTVGTEDMSGCLVD